MSDSGPHVVRSSVLGGGVRLLVKNGWSRQADDAMSAGGFDALELRGGEYPDLDCLIAHGSAIRSLILECEVGDASALGGLGSLANLTLNAKLGKGFNFTSLKSLTFANFNAWQPHLASSLFHSPTLRVLRIEGYDVVDCHAFGGLRSLERLTLAKGKLKSTAGLSHCPRLRALDFAHLRHLKDISELGGCEHLRELELSEALPSLTDVSAIFKLSLFRRLDLRGVKGTFEDIAWLRRFRELHVLGIANVEPVDWDSLLASPVLKKLFVRFEKAPGLSPVQVREIALARGFGVTDVQALGNPKKPLGFVLEFRPAGSNQNLWYWDDAKTVR
ncbi:MAG: hypothetical protein WBV39_10580 [Rudaea sp.]